MARGKRRPVIVSDHKSSEGEPEIIAEDDAPEPPAKRRKRPTDKQKQIDEDNTEKTVSEAQKLKNKVRKLRKDLAQAKELAAAASHPISEDDEFESEERSDDEEALASLQPKLPVPAVTTNPRLEVHPVEVAPPLATAESTAAPPSAERPPVTRQPATTLPSATDDSDITMPITAPLTQMIQAPFRDGQTPLKGRGNASDYAEEVEAVLLCAVQFFYCLIYTEDMWPSHVTQRKLVCRAWKLACDAQDEPVVWWLSERMICIISARKSNARGDVSDEIRKYIPNAYLKFRDGMKTPTQRYNAALAKALLDDGTFHHKTFNIQTGNKSPGLAEHTFIVKAAKLAFFAHPSSIGFVHPTFFDPMPEEAIAFLLTVIHAHITKWATGVHVKDAFDETKNKDKYHGFLKDLKAYGAKNQAAWLNIRKQLYRCAFVAGGRVPVQMNTL
ncbi:hypothetical protein C8Q76DRAFT_803281 [Earliella scabrosa]|nr:hypothetical protein C8Q76DRAFT_803281 [Earliella scabrosa]